MHVRLFMIAVFSITFLFTPQVFAGTTLLYYNSKHQIGSELHYEDSVADGYYIYVNSRFAYLLDIPKEFNYVINIPGNNDGIAVASIKSNAVLQTNGHYLGTESGRDRYDNQIRRLGEKVVYSSWQLNYYVISWIEPGDSLTHGDLIYYQKVFFDEEYYNQFTIKYPVTKKAYFDSIVNHMEESFIPGWKTGLKIYG